MSCGVLPSMSWKEPMIIEAGFVEAQETLSEHVKGRRALTLLPSSLIL